MLTLADILEIENTPEILQFTCPGTDDLLWHSIRTLVLRMVIDQEVFGKPTQVTQEPGVSQSRIQKAKCVLDGLLYHVRLFNRRADILFFNSGITNILRNGRYFNRVSDYFALCYPESTLMIEEPHEWHHLRPRANPNVVYHIPFRMLVLLGAKSSPRRNINVATLNLLNYVRERVKDVTGFQLSQSQLAFLQRMVGQYCASLNAQRMIYSALYKALRPKLIFFEDGSYGAKGPLIRTAKEMGILTAEMQHGMISSGHDAYNYAPLIRESAGYRRYLPDFFLSYGQWWSNQINLPAEVVPVGNPHYEVSRRHAVENVSPSRTMILLLSSGLDFEAYLAMARTLRNIVPAEYPVVIRPHPLERSAALSRYGQNPDGILLDTTDNLYARLAESYAVVGENSTALFEAVGLVERIFCMTSPLSSFGLPDSPFEKFERVEELAAKMFAPGCGVISPELATSIWTGDWEANYRSFITQRVGLQA